MKRLMLVLAGSTAALTLAPAAHAVTIVPGSSGLIFTPFDSLTQGSVLATNSVAANALTFSSVFRSAVYRNSSGTLDFYYQIARTGGGPNGSNQIDAFTAADFTGFNVTGFVSSGDPDGAGFFTAVNNPGGSTTTTGRSPSGAVLQTFFTPNGLMETENSATYIFRTDATVFTTGTFGILNGSSAQGFTFAPQVPEPATWLTMILGFGAVGFAIRRKPRTRVTYTV